MMMLNKQKVLLAVGILGVIGASPLYAKDFSYTYVEGGFADVDIDNEDADYIYGGGSLALDKNIFIRGSLGNLDVNKNLEFDTVSIGVGHPMRMSERSDLVLALDYSFAESDSKNPAFDNVDVDTLTGSAMTRTWLTNNIEGNLMGGLAYQDADYGDSDTGAVLGAGIRVYVVPQFSVGANISRSFIGDLDTDEIGVNARLQF
ncbi:outer membrane beta-barrel protein [Zhongshania guokunii]|uniref:Outer membrane beta-barrel protein n=1 Tax=Zhongshania guokunii TaxID=641783 RepID=A0ABV3U8T6_9GAMM